MVLEGGTRLVSDVGFSAESVVRSMGPADVPTDADGNFGFVAGRVPEDVVIANRPTWDGTVEGRPEYDPTFDDAPIEAIVIITSPFAPPFPGVREIEGAVPRVRVPAYCCYTTSAEQTTDGLRRFLLIAHDKPGHAAAARRDERRSSAEVWCAIVETEPGSGEPATLLDEVWTTPAALKATRARITQQHGKHQVIDLPSTNAVERAAHADAVRCALTHQH
jgi:hypothetical protein